MSGRRKGRRAGRGKVFPVARRLFGRLLVMRLTTDSRRVGSGLPRAVGRPTRCQAPVCPCRGGSPVAIVRDPRSAREAPGEVLAVHSAAGCGIRTSSSITIVYPELPTTLDQRVMKPSRTISGARIPRLASGTRFVLHSSGCMQPTARLWPLSCLPAWSFRRFSWPGSRTLPLSRSVQLARRAGCCRCWAGWVQVSSGGEFRSLRARHSTFGDALGRR